LLISPIAKSFDYWVLVHISRCVICLGKLSERQPLGWAFLIVLLFPTPASIFSWCQDQLRISPCKDKNKRIRHLCLKKKKIICCRIVKKIINP
jgi:hypothetical protein